MNEKWLADSKPVLAELTGVELELVYSLSVYKVHLFFAVVCSWHGTVLHSDQYSVNEKWLADSKPVLAELTGVELELVYSLSVYKVHLFFTVVCSWHGSYQ